MGTVMTEEQKKIKKARKILSDIAEFLDGPLDPHTPGWNLWHVLAMLRGPDSESITVKNASTAKIRAIVGLKRNHNIGGGDVASSVVSISENLEDVASRENGNYSYHFNFHHRIAVQALKGLGLLNADGTPMPVNRKK